MFFLRFISIKYMSGFLKRMYEGLGEVMKRIVKLPKLLTDLLIQKVNAIPMQCLLTF